MLDKLLPRWLRPVDHHREPHGAARFRVSEEALLARRLELLGLRGLKGVRVTDNRTVMVSLSPRGVLRIHRGYTLAPDRVLLSLIHI